MKRQSHSDVSVELSGHVAVVEFNRPPHNHFDAALLAAIAEALATLDETPECRVTLLASQGRCFCAGADFNGPEKLEPSSVYRAALPLFRRRKPLVAVIQGPAVGGGLGLALAADFRFAAPEARFHANFVALGLHPGFGLTYTLPRAIGTQKATHLLLSGRRVDGTEALQLGLADAVAPLASLRSTAVKFAGALATGAPLAIRSIQSALIDGVAEHVERAMEREAAAQAVLMSTADFKEGVRATAERRPPDFTGR